MVLAPPGVGFVEAASLLTLEARCSPPHLISPVNTHDIERTTCLGRMLRFVMYPTGTVGERYSPNCLEVRVLVSWRVSTLNPFVSEGV